MNELLTIAFGLSGMIVGGMIAYALGRFLRNYL